MTAPPRRAATVRVVLSRPVGEPMLHRPPSPAAARARRYRQRQRARRLSVTLELDQSETAVLRRLNCLTSDAELENRAAIAEALHRLIASIDLGISRKARSNLSAADKA
jgi:hypothetical protein